MACLFLVPPSKDDIGDYQPPDYQHPRQDYKLYRMLNDAINMAANAE